VISRIDLDLALHVPVDDLGHVGAARARRRRPCPSSRGPVTSWNGRVLISWPASATPMMIDWPQPRWQASSAWRITSVLPVQSKV
jgi:hypothetical protein